MTIELKGVNAYEARNRLAIMVTSNSPRAVPIEPNDRRTTVIKVSNLRTNDTAYFEKLWLSWDSGGREAFIRYLLKRDLNGFTSRIPLATPEKELAAGAAGDLVTRWWRDALEGAAELLFGQAHTDWETNAAYISNAEMIRIFRLYARDVGEAQHLPSQQEVLERIGSLCPNRVEGRKRARDGRMEPRGATYPPLSECRDALLQAMGAKV